MACAGLIPAFVILPGWFAGAPWLPLYLPSLPSSSRDLLPVCVCVFLQMSPFYKGHPYWIRTHPKNPSGIEPMSPALGGGFFIMSSQGSPTETHFKCFLEPKLKGDFRLSIPYVWGFHSGWVIKNVPANAGDAGSIPGLRRSPGEGNGNPLQYACLENPMNRGAWWATVQGVAKESDTT